jgi:hypothetical protein
MEVAEPDRVFLADIKSGDVRKASRRSGIGWRPSWTARAGLVFAALAKQLLDTLKALHKLSPDQPASPSRMSCGSGGLGGLVSRTALIL